MEYMVVMFVKTKEYLGMDALLPEIGHVLLQEVRWELTRRY